MQNKSDDVYKVLYKASLAHIESFDFALREGFYSMIQNIPPLQMLLPNNDRIEVKLERCSVGMPAVKRGTVARTFKIYPAECRSRGVTYKAGFQVEISWSLNGQKQEVIQHKIGEIPIMVKSKACNLEKLSSKELISVGEEASEFGGYFIINGLEKVVRLLIAQRRNYPIAMQRNGWKKRGDLFSEYGVSVRCVRDDQSGSNIVMHYLTDGTVKLMFTYKREMYVVPLMTVLKALVDETDYSIYEHLTRGKEKDSFYQGCIKNMLRKTASIGIFSQDQALHYLGEKFRVKLDVPPWYTQAEVTRFLIEQSICVHLKCAKEKFDFLAFMLKKLFALVKNESAIESPDNPMNHEILTPGGLYLIVIKEKLQAWLSFLRVAIEKKLNATNSTTVNQGLMRHVFSRAFSLTRFVENFLSTGNFKPRYESSLLQFSGLAVVADKLNFWRFLSHFRAVHRGAFFAEMRTTAVRKLLPEAWGFLCPVHTPDGTPCGLLNHMTASCQVVNRQPKTDHLFNLFCQWGLLPVDDPMQNGASYDVLLDGKVLGSVCDAMAEGFVAKLRYAKCLEKHNVSRDAEICFVRKTRHASQFPGIFLFTGVSRLARPVRNLQLNTAELVGTFEQVYLHIAVTPHQVESGVTLHAEISSTSILSVLANQIPFSDHNQSPRNMYECQMGKQTMGTASHALRFRSDNKMYHLRTPQLPLVRPDMHDDYQMDDFPIGTNAIVAVISYSGYDMEDAIVLNRASVQRGFEHASLYKTEVVNLRDVAGGDALCFGRRPGDDLAAWIDADGLPHVGTRLREGDPVCSYIENSGKVSCVRYRSSEEAYVEDVKLLGNDTGTETNTKIAIKYRVPRNPIIGDKFASRHGQKGICSILLPQEDMPFTDGGMTPDILFNPHGFPSRMTIGMMIESMAGKDASLRGVRHDASPFAFDERRPAVEHFAECLRAAGYDYYGTERMYSGTTGEELEADIFFGVVYYQRLRHMVADKYQVRTTGPVDPYTRQPVKGRKRGGGIRFGEMERDALIAHGAALLLHDRLFSCSDASQQYVCGTCQDLLSPVFRRQEYATDLEHSSRAWTCVMCSSDQNVHLVDLPYVFRYLCVELAAMNIKIGLVLGHFS